MGYLPIYDRLKGWPRYYQLIGTVEYDHLHRLTLRLILWLRELRRACEETAWRR